VPGPRITEAQAGVIVTNLAREEKIKLENFQPPQIEFNAARRQWDFSYTLKPPGRPGGFFFNHG